VKKISRKNSGRFQTIDKALLRGGDVRKHLCERIGVV
jgi:hypothetical protein